MIMNYILEDFYFRMRYDYKRALVILFSIICEYAYLATSNSKPNNDSGLFDLNKFTNRNEFDCCSCEDLIKNKTASSVIKFQVRN